MVLNYQISSPETMERAICELGIVPFFTSAILGRYQKRRARLAWREKNLVECEIDGVVSVYSELFINPFLVWDKYRRKLFKTTLPISFQSHYIQMNGFEATRFLNGLQEVINKLNTWFVDW